MELTLQEKLKLINFFEFLLNEEISKPLGEMNSEAVDNYIKILLHLQDKHIELSSEFIEEQVRKIFHPKENTVPEAVKLKTTKKYFNKKKVWLVAACIAILVALFSIVSFSSEKGVVDTLEDFFGTFEFIPFGKETNVGNETYKKEGLGKEYKSIIEVVSNEKLDILFPSNLINHIKMISYTYYDAGNNTINIAFNDPDLFINITTNSNLTDKTIKYCSDKVTINNIDYYICVMDDISQVQAYFQYNNNLYIVAHSDEDELINILKNMKEIKYED